MAAAWKFPDRAEAINAATRCCAIQVPLAVEGQGALRSGGIGAGEIRDIRDGCAALGNFPYVPIPIETASSRAKKISATVEDGRAFRRFAIGSRENANGVDRQIEENAALQHIH